MIINEKLSIKDALCLYSTLALVALIFGAILWVGYDASRTPSSLCVETCTRICELEDK
jgi:hypothetical protein